MELYEVSKVAVLDCQNEVNEYLALGWKIITVYKTSYTGLPDSTQTPHFIMGWVGVDPKYPEKPEETSLPW